MTKSAETIGKILGVATVLTLLAISPAFANTALKTLREGDDLIVVNGQARIKIKDFLFGVEGDMTAELNIDLPGRGLCVLSISATGALVGSTCEK